VQTHLATAPLVLAMAAVLVVPAVRRWRSAGRPGWGRAGRFGVAALTLIWIPPVVELWRDRPDNIQLLWDFFASPSSTPSLGHALHVAADALTVMPFGNHDYVLALHRGAPAIALAAMAGLAMLVIVVRVGRRRHEPMSAALAAGAVLGIVIGTASLTRTDGPVYLYFAVWLAFVPLSLALALGAALVGEPSDRTSRSSVGHTRMVVIALCLGALVAAGSTVRSDLSMGPVSTTTGSGPWPPGNAGTVQGKARTIRNTVALTEAAESVLRPGDRWVGLTIASSAVWPYAAGIVLGLDEHGVQSTVGPVEWALYFGHERLPGRPVTVVFRLYPSKDTALGTVVADLDGVALTYERISP